MSGEIVVLWGVAIIMTLSAVAYLAMLTITSRPWSNAAIASAAVVGAITALVCSRVTTWQVALPVGLMAFSVWSYFWWQVAAVLAHARKRRVTDGTASSSNDMPRR